MKTRWSHILAAIGAVHCGILLIAPLTLDLIRILHRAGEGSRERVDEHASGEVIHPIVRDLAHLTPRLLVEIKLLFLKAFEAEGVQAGKGLWLLDSLAANRTLDQLGNYGEWWE